MREDQVDRIAQALENIAMNLCAIAASQQVASQPTFWSTNTLVVQSEEAELSTIRTRIDVVGNLVNDLSRGLDSLRGLGRMEEQHACDLVDAMNEMNRLLLREKALRSSIALNNPVSLEAGLP